MTLLTPHGGRHDACVTSYRLLSATPLLRAHMTSQSSSGQGLRNLLIGSNSVNGGFKKIVDNEKILTLGGNLFHVWDIQ